MQFFAPILAAALAASAPHAMVVTEQQYASQAGIGVLQRGGNAVDAAVAVGYALAVVDPCCGNLGGGGFMLIRMQDGRERFIDFRERAPLAATPTMFQDASGHVDVMRSRKGWLAVAVPGTVMGLERARREYGTMSRSTLLAPAISLARDGYVFASGDLIPFRGSKTEGYSGAYTFDTQPNIRAIWKAHGDFPHPGERVRQPQLAHTLELIAAGGENAFYRGPIARAIVAASRAGGGILSEADFASYTVDERAPLHCSFDGYQLSVAAPPSSGGVTLCETLNIIGPFDFAHNAWHSVAETHRVIEAERRAYADRNAYIGDPAFVHNPIDRLLDPSYAATLRAQIDPDKATPSVDVHPGLGATPEGMHTTHFSIVDKDGNAVAVTYTINDWFGADIIAGDTGFFLNDEMDDFTTKAGVPNEFGLVQGPQNLPAPGKRPLSSMTPTIVTKDGHLQMVTGSPGGSRITTITLETILNALVYGMSVKEAVDASRIHMQWLPDEIQYEPGALTPEAIAALRAQGYAFREIPAWGSAQAILVRNGMLHGGSDRRHPAGAAIGY